MGWYGGAGGREVQTLLSLPTTVRAVPALDASGTLRGAANNGGNTSCKTGCGTIFSLQAAASGAWPFTLLYSFTGGSDGNYPNSLISDSAGNLYGTASGGGSGTGGVVFELPAPQ